MSKDPVLGAEGFWDLLRAVRSLLEDPVAPLDGVLDQALEVEELPLARRRASHDLGGCARAPSAVLASKQPEQAVDAVSADQVLGEEICRILFTSHFVK